MSLKYVVEVFKLASKEVLGDYLSLEKFIELEKHLKSKTLNSEDTINLLNPQDIEFFIKVSKLAKARYFNDIEDVLTNLLFPYQDILKEISKYNNSYDKIIKFKILDRELFEEFCQIIESKEYKDSAWFEIYNLKTKITYEEIIKNLQKLKGKIIDICKNMFLHTVCNSLYEVFLKMNEEINSKSSNFYVKSALDAFAVYGATSENITKYKEVSGIEIFKNEVKKEIPYASKHEIQAVWNAIIKPKLENL